MRVEPPPPQCPAAIHPHPPPALPLARFVKFQNVSSLFIFADREGGCAEGARTSAGGLCASRCLPRRIARIPASCTLRPPPPSGHRAGGERCALSCVKFVGQVIAATDMKALKKMEGSE